MKMTILSTGPSAGCQAAPVNACGSPEKAAGLLAAIAPFDLADAKRRRWCYRKKCRQIIQNFAEKREVVEPLLPEIIRATEDLLMAGLRRDALYQAW